MNWPELHFSIETLNLPPQLFWLGDCTCYPTLENKCLQTRTKFKNFSIELRRAYRSLAKLNASAFRSAGVKYANEEDMISGAGASCNGGRWNPPGVLAVYDSLDPVTAVKEAYQEFLKYGFAASCMKPRVMAGLDLNVTLLLDLTNSIVRQKIGFTYTELVSEDWHAIQSQGDESWTQAIGRGAKVTGFEGLLVPSARNRRGENVVIFPDNLTSKSVCRLAAKKDLPPHPDKWPK